MSEMVREAVYRSLESHRYDPFDFTSLEFIIIDAIEAALEAQERERRTPPTPDAP